MPYIIIEDFRAGLDRRKLPVSSPQGTLQTLSNAHVTRGGEIEKRLAFVPQYSLPANQTHGFDGADGTLYVWGSVPDPGVPIGVTYQQLSAPGGAAMARVVATEFFDGKPFVAAEYADGAMHYFYDGTLVDDWEAGDPAHVAGRDAAALLTVRDKMYAANGSLLSFSAIADPVDWDAGVGAGFKNMSNQTAGSETLTALGRYQNLMAVFARRSIQLWYLDPDPLENVQKQVLSNIGTFAPKSVVSYGDADVFFLADSGVRSLRARDSSNQSGVADIGTPVDEFLLEHLATLTQAEREASVGVLEPLSGRYILFVGAKAFVFSYFSTSRTSAWSTYDLDEPVTDACAIDGRVWLRVGDSLLLLGGDDGRTYDSSKVEVELPYIDGRSIATFKRFKGVDVVCEGAWTLYVNTDPGQPSEESKIAGIANTTINMDSLGMTGRSPVIKFRLVSEAPGPARLSKLVVHYELDKAS